MEFILGFLSLWVLIIIIVSMVDGEEAGLDVLAWPFTAYSLVYDKITGYKDPSKSNRYRSNEFYQDDYMRERERERERERQREQEYDEDRAREKAYRKWKEYEEYTNQFKYKEEKKTAYTKSDMLYDYAMHREAYIQYAVIWETYIINQLRSYGLTSDEQVIDVIFKLRVKQNTVGTNKYTRPKQQQQQQSNYNSSSKTYVTKEDEWFAALEIPKTDNWETIKTAYKKAAIKYHPDKHTKSSPQVKKQNEEKFKQASNAYENLEKREKAKKATV